MLIFGGVFVLFGIVDLVGSFAEFDLWGTIGVELPAAIWSFSAWIELAIGFALIKLARSRTEIATE